MGRRSPFVSILISLIDSTHRCLYQPDIQGYASRLLSRFPIWNQALAWSDQGR